MANGKVIKFNPDQRMRNTGHPHNPSLSWSALVAITAGMSIAPIVAIFLTDGPMVNRAVVADPHQVRFTYCFGSNRTNCVVDGDTIWFDGRKIRIADINTPEISNPGCSFEAELGQKAKYRLQELLNQAAFSLENINRDKDQYGRNLRILTREGRSLGNIMIEEGLAERWQGYRRNWC